MKNSQCSIKDIKKSNENAIKPKKKDLKVIDFKKKNIFDNIGINDIQREIQNITKKIEKKKIELRISDERYIKQQIKYNEIKGNSSSISDKKRNNNKKN